MSTNKLHGLHDALCYPKVTRMMHSVRAKNLPFSVDEIEKMTTNECKICAKVKPHYAWPSHTPLMKATQSCATLSIDFKRPVPSINQSKYLLVIWDEFLRSHLHMFVKMLCTCL